MHHVKSRPASPQSPQSDSPRATTDDAPSWAARFAAAFRVDVSDTLQTSAAPTSDFGGDALSRLQVALEPESPRLSRVSSGLSAYLRSQPAAPQPVVQAYASREGLDSDQESEAADDVASAPVYREGLDSDEESSSAAAAPAPVYREGLDSDRDSEAVEDVASAPVYREGLDSDQESSAADVAPHSPVAARQASFAQSYTEAPVATEQAWDKAEIFAAPPLAKTAAWTEVPIRTPRSVFAAPEPAFEPERFDEKVEVAQAFGVWPPKLAAMPQREPPKPSAPPPASGVSAATYATFVGPQDPVTPPVPVVPGVGAPRVLTRADARLFPAGNGVGLFRPRDDLFAALVGRFARVAISGSEQGAFHALLAGLVHQAVTFPGVRPGIIRRLHALAAPDAKRAAAFARLRGTGITSEAGFKAARAALQHLAFVLEDNPRTAAAYMQRFSDDFDEACGVLQAESVMAHGRKFVPLFDDNAARVAAVTDLAASFGQRVTVATARASARKTAAPKELLKELKHARRGPQEMVLLNTSDGFDLLLPLK